MPCLDVGIIFGINCSRSCSPSDCAKKQPADDIFLPPQDVLAVDIHLVPQVSLALDV